MSQSFEYIDRSNIQNDELEPRPHPNTNILAVIDYLEGLIKKIKNGEVHSFTSVALLKNEKASMWIPGSVEDSDIETTYDSIIKILQDCSPITTSN